ncbi:MAG: serpin family protein [Actinomycetota bacterium]|nr:serpin family protein [Actinomycetota bacterium]
MIALMALVAVLVACGGTSGDDGAGADDPGGGAAGAELAASPDVERSEPDPDAPVDQLVAGFNDAGFELWRSQPEGDDLVFSPLSIGHALLMARAAADEPTGAAIDDAFGLPDGRTAHEAWNALDQAIAASAGASDDVVVAIADRIWPRLDVEPDQDWVDLLVAEHGVTTEPLDFAGAPGESRDVINDWVADRTEQLIPELLPEGFIQPNTVLVLTDAVYFEARWQAPFGKYGTVTDTFTRLDGSTTEVELMRELELADARGTGDGWAAAEIPYTGGGDHSMLVIVPDEGRFAELRDGLDQAVVDEIDATMTTGPYELLVPRWEDSTTIDLLGWLDGLGAAPGSYPLIDPAAELAGAVHAADIAVDEEGTVAAAATGLGFNESGAAEPELTVKADRPFLYLIRHRPTGAVLFAGQVTDPTS